MNTLLWVVFPYAALTVFVVGHVWRWRSDQFGWTTRTTQLLERRWLRWGSPLFHLGAFAAIGGHAMGLLVPKAVTEFVGITEHLYHLMAVGAGSVAAVMLVVGLGLLIARRVLEPRINRTTTKSDKALFTVLGFVVAMGVTATVVEQLFKGGYDYRETISVWFRGLFALNPDPLLMVDVPLVFQLHALSAFLLFAIWPFTRLVHVWSAPIAYLWRPYVVYRRRSTTPRRPMARR
ncbi:respiratory nitrate reductase subunit gamma [Actinosynnema pretiosum subsp. pretiosum]|uniref:Nitrate reductase-like protein NarX n=1 Tax=Actinosynnema pretiosum subsp. pretiosum TaxID=103721 RepID=A0AA45R5Y5_9PSEU|nr:Respiratory nitrate reductase gamma chain [Actinosynnema pretiosum subsp. pretiosum]QUF06319.1 respiratory nitrate reductase subunit gamma [Actinosynnema pretiosum subsp. pretiosum]